MADLSITDADCERALTQITTAVGAMVSGNRPRDVGGWESLSDIALDVDRFQLGMQVGRAALADAARTAGQMVRELMQATDALDAAVTAALEAGFAVQGHAQ